jgi:aminopeptidase YwaD
MIDASVDQLARRVSHSRSLWSDLNRLCSFGGRFAGTESERKAADFLTERLRSIAQATVNIHEVSYCGWARESCELKRLTPNPLALHAHALVRSPSTPPGGIECEVIDLGRGSLEDFKASKAEISGRFVLVRHEFMFASGHIHRRVKYQWAKERGAVGFMIASHLPGDLVIAGSSGGDEIPAVGITRESAEALTRTSVKYPRVHLDLRTRTQSAVARNLIAEIPGRTDEWVVLCAHYDGHDLAQSAIDNGAGVAAALTIAREIAPMVSSLQRGLRVIFFTIEEWGLMGSRAYVDALSQKERQQIALVINLDSIVGGSKLTALTSGFEEFGSFVSAVSAITGTAMGIHLPMMANSDHYNFARYGIPALRLVSGFDEPESRLRYLLTAGDSLDKITPEELAAAASTAAAMVYEACAVKDWPT